jgi:hypothetical protein
VYVGDVTALCALPPTGDDADAADTASDGARPRAHDTLLAGTGASLKWYDPFRAGGDVPLLSTTVFPSARVHGILPSPDLDAFVASASGASGGRAILVWGERRVAVATLRAGAGVAPDARELRVTRALPPLGHWVHDARPMRPDAHALAETTVAVGLADNAVEQWSLGGADAFSAASSPPALLRRVECSHRSMLYSLALRGSRMADLRVAGGTIFNEVQLWAPGAADAAVSRKTEGASEATSSDGVRRPPPFAILRGHEGSIMRVSWSRDGTRVFSTSDDRTARTWRVTDRGGDPGGEAAATAATGTEIRARADSVLYGHGGRVWDCQPARAGQRRLLVTAGEDCAVRLWEDTTHESPVRETPSERSLGAPTKEKQKGAKEDPVAVLRGHRGRGVWRCVTVRNPRGSDTLVTAGADASIKLWDLSEYEAGPFNEKTKNEDGEASATAGDRGVDAFAGDAMPEECASRTEETRDTPRAVCLTAPGVVFVGTERGAVHEARRPKMSAESESNARGWVWRANLFAEPSGAAIVSVADARASGTRLAANERYGGSTARLAIGDASGRVAVIAVADGATAATMLWSARASPPRRLLDVLVGHGGDIFTVVVGGAVALWRANEGNERKSATWVADGVAHSPFRQRALCASRRGGVFALGDQSGNVAVFDASGGATVAGSVPGGAEDGPEAPGDAASLPLLAAERGAHGAHSVAFVQIRLPGGGGAGAGAAAATEAEIVTGGRDGRLCVFALRESSGATDEETHRAARRVDFERKFVTECEAALTAADEKTRKKAARAVAAALGRVETARAASLAVAAPFRLERDAASSVTGVSSVDGALWGDEDASTAPDYVAGFRETDFVIRDMRDQAETLRVACGGWRRPFSLLMRSADPGVSAAGASSAADATFAFAFVKNGRLTECARREDADADENEGEAGERTWRARALNVWSHGYATVPFFFPAKGVFRFRFSFFVFRFRYPVTFHNSNPRPRSRRATEGGAAYAHDPRGHASLPPASDAAAAAETRGVRTRLVRSKGDSEGTANARDIALFFFRDSRFFFF